MRKYSKYFEIETSMEISAAHCLPLLPYDSKCKNFHGHNWRIMVRIRTKELHPHTGMVVDFSTIKSKIKERFDHTCLNEDLLLGDFPTAERIAEEIGGVVRLLLKDMSEVSRIEITVQESEGNLARFVMRSKEKSTDNGR